MKCSTFSVLGDKIFPGKHFYQPLIFETQTGSEPNTDRFQTKIYFNPSHAAIKISINATAAEFICKNIFPKPVQIKKIIKNKIGDIQQIYLYQNVCK